MQAELEEWKTRHHVCRGDTHLTNVAEQHKSLGDMVADLRFESDRCALDLVRYILRESKLDSQKILAAKLLAWAMLGPR